MYMLIYEMMHVFVYMIYMFIHVDRYVYIVYWISYAVAKR